MAEFIKSHVMELLWGVAICLLGGVWKTVNLNFKKLIHDNVNMKDGVKAVLHDRLIQKCTHLLNVQGYITADDLEELEELNAPYEALGGNGTVKTAIKKVKLLPLK